MFGMAISQNLPQLMIFRFVVGMCVGALLPSLSIMVVEFSNEKRGNLFLALVHIGFAIGAILGAAIGAAVVEDLWLASHLPHGRNHHQPYNRCLLRGAARIRELSARTAASECFGSASTRSASASANLR